MDKRNERIAIRVGGMGYYHLCTDGLKGTLLFNNPAEYAFGMLMIGLLSIKFSISVYAFVLMPNHIHIILSGTGENCLNSFDYLKRKLSARLIKDAYSPLPPDYWFKLVKIETPEQMRSELIYVLRNPLEKGLASVSGYLWGSGWLYYSDIPSVLAGTPVGELSKRALAKMLSSEESLPEDWLIHPHLGLLPGSFVDTSLVLKLFPTPKDLQTALVKDYEVFFQIASRLGEVAEFSKREIDSIVEQLLQKRFDGKPVKELSDKEKAQLALILKREYGLTTYQISKSIFVKEVVIRQLLNSKELR